jgi:catechol 2,3-dioxygenase-like lactoylglutathione lyase family enzyme
VGLRFRHDHVGITLAADHLQRVIDWYQDAMDFVVLTQFGAGTSMFTFIGNGEVKVELISAGAQPSPAAPAQTLPASHDVERLHHFCLAVTDLDATLQELADRDVPVFAGPMQIDHIGQRIAFVRDPVGTIIEITQSSPAQS